MSKFDVEQLLKKKYLHQYTSEEKAFLEEYSKQLTEKLQVLRDEINGFAGETLYPRIFLHTKISYGCNVILTVLKYSDNSDIGTFVKVDTLTPNEARSLIEKLQKFLTAQELYDVRRQIGNKLSGRD